VASGQAGLRVLPSTVRSVWNTSAANAKKAMRKVQEEMEALRGKHGKAN
jgi:hypothetical protein